MEGMGQRDGGSGLRRKEVDEALCSEVLSRSGVVS